MMLTDRANLGCVAAPLRHTRRVLESIIQSPTLSLVWTDDANFAVRIMRHEILHVAHNKADFLIIEPGRTE